MKKLILRLYLFTHAIRKSVVYSVFGYMHHCKHSPTCGRYFISQVEKKGVLVGSMRGLWRILRCW